MSFKEVVQRSIALIPALSAIVVASIDAAYCASKYGYTRGIISGIINGLLILFFNIWGINIAMKIKERKSKKLNINTQNQGE